MILLDKLKENDKKLSPPVVGQWLYEHKEPGQPFDKYILIDPVSPNETQKLIYLQPIGEFTKQQNEVVKFTADYIQMFFNLKTIILPVISDESIPAKSRRMRENNTEQLHTTYILKEMLAKNIPKDAIVIMAVTAKDLYPEESWNFVFGQAYTKDRIGVSSIFRYCEKPLDSLNYNLCLNRLIKTSCHEIGHMFSVYHCTNAECIMNGSNSLYESDTQPNRLCSECLKKMYWNLKFNNVERLKAIRDYFQKHNLEKDYSLTIKDLAAITAGN
jgi:archaemetzincin